MIPFWVARLPKVELHSHLGGFATSGESLEQVRAAALQVVEGLEDGEAFNIILFHEAVESFAPEPVIKNAETMRAARAYIRLCVRIQHGKGMPIR